MGEYFKSGAKEVKLGTCEHLMYVRRDELERATKERDIANEADGNLPKMSDYLKLEHNFIYRFPRASEDGQTWNQADGRQPFDYIEIDVNINDVDIPHNSFMQTQINGITFNLPFCPLSDKATELDVRPINYYNRAKIQIVGERYNPNNPNGYTLFKCAFCNMWFACDEKELPHIQDSLRFAGYEVEADRIKARKK